MFHSRIMHIEWSLDLQKPHYMKNSEYKMGFEEISVPFNEKIFKIEKRKSKVPDLKGKVSLFVTTFIIFYWFYYFLIVF